MSSEEAEAWKDEQRTKEHGCLRKLPLVRGLGLRGKVGKK